MHKSQPHVILLAGPNGAGKTTVAPALLQGQLHVSEFVNADVIAQGLSGFNPERMAFQAGRIMLKRLQELAIEKKNFAFETTLSSRTFASWLKRLKQKNYLFHLFYLWLPNAEVCKKRVADRVSMGGHAVPVHVIERRYRRGLNNFFNLYLPLADSWDLIDNSTVNNPQIIASYSGKEINISNLELWKNIQERHHVSKKSH